MHRIAFALALTAFCAPALVAQQVTAELYGDFRYSYNRADAADATHWTAVNNASRFGPRAAGPRFLHASELIGGRHLRPHRAPHSVTFATTASAARKTLSVFASFGP